MSDRYSKIKHSSNVKLIKKYEEKFNRPYTEFIHYYNYPDTSYYNHNTYWANILIENKRLSTRFLDEFADYFDYPNRGSESYYHEPCWHVLMYNQQLLDFNFIKKHADKYTLKNSNKKNVWAIVVSKQFKKLSPEQQKELFKKYYLYWDDNTLQSYIKYHYRSYTCKDLLQTTIQPKKLSKNMSRFGRIHITKTLIGHNNLIAQFPGDDKGLFSNVDSAYVVIEDLLGER